MQQILAISNGQLDKLAERVDRIMATAGHASSIHVINAENQNLKTMLTDISSRLSRLETMKDLPPVDQKEVPIAANGTAISTYNQSPMTSDFEECSHDYSLLPQSRNLEADFLRHYGLLVDIRMDARWTG
ncbi:hypothetical protein TNIN_494741 [Trichonephila inaurata madagascariensis]|uniref:Uncharacterized protein n=1 Tax=Trichonephila inaurata madagascariensis TaxID=2747483 RepID=A0A8X6YJS8_9ARAC|nr:hypothetical protein TNIN_494741 [Trichonephila inaurata madagascariensis]